jgi:hypothetical protein
MWNRLTVSVHDHDPQLPQVHGHAAGEPLSTSGRGLELVASISESWGMRARHDGSGKTVWFSLPVPPPDAASQRNKHSHHPGTVAVHDAEAPGTGPAPVPPPTEVEPAAAG